MKIRVLGIAVAAAALFSACQTLDVQVTVEPAVEVNDASGYFSASLGADTKTYLEEVDGVYKVRWDEGDHFTVYNADALSAAEDVTLVSGAGTSDAVFTGSLKADKYLAYYGYRLNVEAGVFYPAISNYQSSRVAYNQNLEDYESVENLWAYEFPMAAVSEDRDFEFQNVASILKVSLVGDGKYIKNVVVTPNDPTVRIAGRADLVEENGEMSLVMRPDSVGNFVQYEIEAELDPVTPVNCYLVVPAQTYTGGFTVTINSADGYMDVTTTADVVMEKSQLRAIPTITYEQEFTSAWGLIGDSSNWTEDTVMEYADGYWVLKNHYLEALSEFKFRSNGDWAVNFGGYGTNIAMINGGTSVVHDGANLWVETSGYYDIYLDVEYEWVYIMDAGVPLGTYYECADYFELAAMEDGTCVITEGIVFAATQRGFILNASYNYYGNEIYVYQGVDQSSYAPVIGNSVKVYAQKTTYNGLPELTPVYKVVILDDQEYDWGYGYDYDLTAVEDFVSFTYDAYVYVKYTGRLEKSGNYYNVYVGDQTDRVGSLSFPVQDLTDFLDKQVYVEGYFMGFSGNGKYLNTVLKEISLPETDGGTEDVVPGDDIEMTKAPLKIR